MANLKNRNKDSARRDDQRMGRFDRCEITRCYPHVSPFNKGDGDLDFNVCDVRIINQNHTTNPAPYPRVRLLCSQDFSHGRLQGHPWNPRIGDQVLIVWINDKEAIALCSLVSAQQEPVCRSCADEFDQEYVDKICPYPGEPGRDKNDNFIDFPKPRHPNCVKWWPIRPDNTREGFQAAAFDTLQIFDCPYGNNRPECDYETPCNSLDDIAAGTWIKNFCYRSPTSTDLPRRYKFHHHCGSFYYFDEDGTFHLENRVSENPRSRIKLYPNGKMELYQYDTGAYIIIDENGQILEHSPKRIWLDAPYTEVTGDLKVDGVLCHQVCSCDGAQDFTNFSKTDSGNKIATPKPSSCICSGMGCNESSYIVDDKGVDHFDDCEISFNCNVSSCDSGACGGCCGLTNNDSDDLLKALNKKLVVDCHGTDKKLRLALYDGSSIVTSQEVTIALATTYYCLLNRPAGATTATLKLYSDPEYQTLITTLSISNSSLNTKFRYLYALSSMNNDTAPTISIAVNDMVVHSPSENWKPLGSVKVINEMLTGSGATRTFAYVPKDGTVILHRRYTFYDYDDNIQTGSCIMIPLTEYTISGKTVTLVGGSSGDTYIASYEKTNDVLG